MSMSRVSVNAPSGPLLWHFEENTTSDPSIELDLEEVKTLAAHIGFEIKVGISWPSLVSHSLHLHFIRTNAQSIRPTSIIKIQCSGMYTTPLSGRPRRSCSFARAISTKLKQRVYHIDTYIAWFTSLTSLGSVVDQIWQSQGVDSFDKLHFFQEVSFITIWYVW
jgi:hypothetical protein